MQTKYHQAGLEMKPIEKERETKEKIVKVNGGGNEGGTFQLATAGETETEGEASLRTYGNGLNNLSQTSFAFLCAS